MALPNDETASSREKVNANFSHFFQRTTSPRVSSKPQKRRSSVVYFTSFFLPFTVALPVLVDFHFEGVYQHDQFCFHLNVSFVAPLPPDCSKRGGNVLFAKC